MLVTNEMLAGQIVKCKGAHWRTVHPDLVLCGSSISWTWVEELSDCRSRHAAIVSAWAVQELNDKRLTLIEGSALSERDLLRAKAENATACLLLADRFSPKPHEEDLNLQFQASHCTPTQAKGRA